MTEQIPLPIDFMPANRHRQFADRHGKSILWLDAQLCHFRLWNEEQGIRRRLRSWDTAFHNWLVKSILIDSEREAGRTAYANNGNSAPVMQPALPPLDGREIFEHSRKYKQMLKDDPSAAESYRWSLPDRIRRLVR